MTNTTEPVSGTAPGAEPKHKSKRPPLPEGPGPFKFVCTLSGLGAAERDELVHIFTDHAPRALEAGASKFELSTSTEGYLVQIIETYDGDDAGAKFHAVHAHDGFQKGHERVKLLHNNVDGRFYRPVQLGSS